MLADAVVTMRNVTLLAIGSLLLVACGARVDLEGVSQPTVSIEAAVSAATLADDCGSSTSSSSAPPSSGAFAGDCAESTDAGAGSARGGCGGWCHQSNLQLALTAEGKGTASIAIAELHLVDAETGAVLDDGNVKNARIWSGSSYLPWTQTISAGQSVKVTYDMTQFDWSKIGGGDSWKTYSRRYKLLIVLRVDGVDRVLTSGELSREPEVAT